MHRESRSPRDSQDLSATAEEEPVEIHTGDVESRGGYGRGFRGVSWPEPLLAPTRTPGAGGWGGAGGAVVGGAGGGGGGQNQVINHL